MIRVLVFASALLALAVCAWSQPQPDTLWTHSYDVVLEEIAEAVAPGPNDGFYLAGWTGSYYQGQSNLLILRCDAAGDTLWSRRFGDLSGWNDLRDIAYTTDGGCAAAGYTETSMESNNAVVIRLDSSGNTLWQHSYGSVGNDVVMMIRQLDDGGFIVGGSASSGNLYLLRLTDVGDTLWTRQFDEAGYLLITDIVVLSNHDFFLSGESYYEADPFFARVDETGNLLWIREYPTFSADDIYSLAMHGEFIYGAGYLTRGNPNRLDVQLMKLNQDGDTVWTHTFGTNDLNEVAHSIIATEDGVVLSGYVSHPETGDVNILLMKYDFNGAMLWSREYGSEWEETANALIQTDDGSFLLAGGNSGSDGAIDMLVLKTGPDQVTSAPNPRVIPLPQIAALSAYPNPFNPQTILAFTLPAAAVAGVVIYDANGRLVRTLSKQMYAAGEHHIAFNGAELPSGIYFARLSAGTNAMTQKLLLVK